MNKRRAYLDTAFFIEVAQNKYDDNSNSSDLIFYQNLIEVAKANKLELFTSTCTILECLKVKDVQEQRFADDKAKKIIDSILLSGQSMITPIEPTSFLIVNARDINWDTKLTISKPLDLLHLASAIELKCEEFITIDFRDFYKNKDKIKELYNIKIVTKEIESSLIPQEFKQGKLEFDEKRKEAK